MLDMSIVQVFVMRDFAHKMSVACCFLLIYFLISVLAVLNVLGVLGVLGVLTGVGCGKRGVARRACAQFFAVEDLSGLRCEP